LIPLYPTHVIEGNDMREGSNKGRYVIETNQIKYLSREKELAVGSKVLLQLSPGKEG
jgi:hypothetical protein